MFGFGFLWKIIKILLNRWHDYDMKNKLMEFGLSQI